MVRPTPPPGPGLMRNVCHHYLPSEDTFFCYTNSSAGRRGNRRRQIVAHSICRERHGPSEIAGRRAEFSAEADQSPHSSRFQLRLHPYLLGGTFPALDMKEHWATRDWCSLLALAKCEPRQKGSLGLPCCVTVRNGPLRVAPEEAVMAVMLTAFL
jgi:hypothetical protein